MVNKNAVGVRIASLRKREDFSQAEFSALLNVSPQAVSKWETGVCLPDIETLLNLSWIFKTTVNNILEGDDYIGEAAGMDRGLMFLNKTLICPECRKKLKLKKTCDNRFSYECENRHEFCVIDGVLESVAKYRQIGNAVPVGLALALGNAVLSVADQSAEIRTKRFRGTDIHQKLKQAIEIGGSCYANK